MTSFKDIIKGGFYALLLISTFVLLFVLMGEWSRHLSVRRAQSKLDAAVIMNQVRIEKANGIAQSNRIIGKSLKNNELFLRYMWIESLWHTKDKVIYLPSDGKIPGFEYCRMEK